LPEPFPVNVEEIDVVMDAARVNARVAKKISPLTLKNPKPVMVNPMLLPILFQNPMRVIIKDSIGSLNPFLVPLVTITPSWLRSPKPLLAVKDKLRVDTTLMPKLNAKPSTFAQLMAKVVFPNILSCAPMEPSLTKLTSSVIGGLTLIVLKLRVFTA
jgi:hypothetical protein